MENDKDAISGSHCASIIRKKEKSSLITIINTGQYPNYSTIIFISQAQPLPKLQLLAINLKWTQSILRTHMTTSILWTITMPAPALLMQMNITTDKMLRSIKILKI